MVGKTISHYKIIRELGRGGMGEVYLAQDTKLDRKVAIKFLPEHLTKDRENVERFEREAKAAAALNHPNIVTIYEIAKEDDQTFIVMEYVEGKTLRELIIENSQFPIPNYFNITAQICEGLSEAHKYDIVHRDIKPENILIDSRGRVKILDFGLAKLKGVSKLTKEASTLGTIHYMSPEQLQGKEVNNRSDIWSLGVLIYEMFTGEVPFTGDYEQAVSYAILNEKPKLLENIQSELQHIVKKSLIKNPDERYVSTAELLQDLSSIQDNFGDNRSKNKSTKTKNTKKKLIYISSAIIFILIATFFSILFFPSSEPEASRKSLAVLPFLNIKEDPNTNFLGFALADQIIGGLNYLQNITVRASSSVREYENRKVNPQQVGIALKVDYILTGNYLVENKNIRLNVELVETQSNNLIWRGDRIEVNYENTFKLQDMVSQKIIDQLKIQFAQDERDRMLVDVPQNPLAYEYFLKSKTYPLSVEGSNYAVEMLKKSIELDSTYAPAFADLGYHKKRLAEHAVGGAASNFKEAEKFLIKALDLNQDQFDALIQLAAYYTDIGKPEQALNLVRKALHINPNSAWAQNGLGYVCRYTGLLDESERAADLVLHLDPFNMRLGGISNIYIQLGKYQRALEVIENYKKVLFSHFLSGKSYLLLGKKVEALQEFNLYIEKEPESMGGLLSTAFKNYIEDKYDVGIEAVRKLDKSKPLDSDVLFRIAECYSLLGEREDCIRVLHQAVEGGFFCYPFLLTDPFLDPVRDDPEFQEVLALAKEKHEAFKQKYFAEE